MKTVRIWTAVLVGAALAGWGLGHSMATKVVSLPDQPTAWTDSTYETHTTHHRGFITSPAKLALQRVAARGPMLLILLHDIDLRNCGDPGRQVRELSVAAEGIPLVVAAGAIPRAEVEWFLRTERIKATLLSDPAIDHLWTDGRSLPTPAAVWIDPALSSGVGVGHTWRYPYVRPRSFAQELANVLDVAKRPDL